MSTKTTFKRVALVAVAALGLGVISVAPSSAAVISTTVTAGTAGATAQLTATTVSSDSTTGTFVTVQSLFQGAGESTSVTFVQKSAPATATVAARMLFVDTNGSTTARVSNNTNAVAGTLATKLAVADSVTAGGNFWINNTGSAGYAGGVFSISLESATATAAAGTYVYTVIATNYTGATQQATQFTTDVSIVVSALASASTTTNASRSTAILNAGTATSATTDASVSVVSTAATTTHATIRVTLNNTAGSANGTESITATVTGAGVIGTSAGIYGKSLLLSSTGTTDILVRADGTAGRGTIAISTPSVTFAPKVITFYAAKAATITAAANKPVIATGSNAAVVFAQAKDGNGTSWGGVAYIYASTAADALIAGSTTTPVACSYVAADDVHACPVSGTTAGTAKFKVIDASTVAAATATSNEVSVRVSAGVPTTVKLAFDKATYAPGEKAQIQVLALDVAGLTLAEQTINNIFATGGISSSTAFSQGSDTLTATFANIAGATSATSGTVVAHQVYTVYMPMSSGTVTISATGGTGLATAGRVAVSASAEVVNSSVDAATDAANEATDAANAATDAALAAADAADAATAAAQDASDAVAALSASVSKLISSLRAQITSLTNLVIKIQKKVRA
jgi:hypothetical protein